MNPQVLSILGAVASGALTFLNVHYCAQAAQIDDKRLQDTFLKEYFEMEKSVKNAFIFAEEHSKRNTSFSITIDNPLTQDEQDKIIEASKDQNGHIGRNNECMLFNFELYLCCS